MPEIPAIVEPLEPRIHLSVFHCYMSATVSSRTVSVVLWTTGGQASQYVVHWNDTNSGGSSSTTYTAPADGTPLTESYTYHGTGSYTPSAVTAVATLKNSSTTATAYYALDKSFGNFQGTTGSGAAADIPNGNTGNVGQTAVAIDTNSADPFYKEEFVASSYYPSGGGGPLFAVTAFSNGQPDSTWGVYNGAANDGTFVVPSFGGGSDVPLAIAYDYNGGGGSPYVIVVGKCSTGWAIAVLNTSANLTVPTSSGNVVMTTGSSLEAGQANAVWADQTDGGGHFVAVGTNGTKMVAVGEYSANLSNYSSWPSPSGIVTLSYVSVSGTSPYYASANSVIEVDDSSNYQGTNEEMIVGGTTSWCNPPGVQNASDFTVVEIDDSSGSVGPLGGIRTNIGQTIGSCAACNDPSIDSVYSVVPFSATGAGPLYLTAVGQTNALSGDRFTMVQYKPNSNNNGLVVNTSFGSSSNGVVSGPTGDAYAAVPDSYSSGTFEVLGASGGDFLIAKYTSSGSLDTTFGNAGVMYQDLGDTSGNNSTDIGYSLELAPDGSLLACGNTLQPGSSYTRIALIDFLDGNQLTVS